jgi:hypothetical protein
MKKPTDYRSDEYPVDFNLSEELQVLKETVRKFVDRELIPLERECRPEREDPEQLTDGLGQRYEVVNTNIKKARLSADSEGLGAWGNERFVIGHVPEVNGSEACEVPQFVPTKHELIQIAKYWFQRRLDNDFYLFVFGQTGSSEWRTNVYANRRINRIADILPEQELNQSIEEVEHDFKQEHKISDADWDVFKNGTQEQRMLYQERFWREVESQNSETPAADGREQLNKC